MNKRTWFVISGFVVAGIASYGGYKHFRRKTNKNAPNVPISEVGLRRVEPVPNQTTETPVDLQGEKERVVASVEERHRLAGQAMRESLQTIFGEEEPVHDTTPESEALKKIDQELDELLK